MGLFMLLAQWNKKPWRLILKFTKNRVYSIFFDKKPNSNLTLYVDYQDIKNITIKNWYLQFLIGKSLNQLRPTKQFT